MAGFRNCLAEYTVHSMLPCYGLLYRIGVVEQCCQFTKMVQHNFLQKWCNFSCFCAWASEGFFQEDTSGFFQTFFYGGGKSGVICCLPLETKKTTFFAEIFKFLSHFRHPCLCVGKNSCHTIKKLV